MQQASMMVDQTRKSGFTSIVLWTVLHLLADISKVYSTVIYVFHGPYLYVRIKKIIGGGGEEGDIAVAHVLIRRTPRHPQAQMARKLLSASLAEIWVLENSVDCSVANFQMSSV
jgi:hypothetical protein